MESIFENTTALTRQNLTEMARATVPPVEPAGRHHPGGFGGRRRHLGSCRRGISLWAGLLLLAAFALVMTTGAPARVALKIAKRNFKKYGSEVTATLCFYEDKVIVHNHQERFRGGPSLRADFSRPSEPPGFICWSSPAKPPLLLEKTAFTKGALEEFPAFMRRKCPGRVAFLRKARKKDLHPGEKCAILFPVKV